MPVYDGSLHDSLSRSCALSSSKDKCSFLHQVNVPKIQAHNQMFVISEKHTNKRMNDRTNKRANEQRTNARTNNERTSGRASKQMNE